MTATILSDIKKLLGIESDYTSFDTDITIHINSVFSLMHQLGVGPQLAPFELTDGTEVWADLIKDATQINFVRSYIYTRVRLLFDAPQTSFGITALKDQASEFEWRLAQLEDIFVIV